jgi:REP element-mobilizing transposase RayT
MSEKFKTKYRISSARMQNWDYCHTGAYFITICTKNREHYFGEIDNGIMQLSPVGAVADVLWYEIKNHAPNIELDTFVVMPNHIHGILILNRDTVETLHATSVHATSLRQQLPTQKNEFMVSISPKPDSVSTIIRSYKSAVTKHARRMGFIFEWQTRFHDHIIRDSKSFETIQSYISENPLKWDDDKLNNQ